MTEIATSVPIYDLHPSLPENFADLPTEQRQVAVDRAKNLLQIRRNLIELESARRRADGEIMQYEADAVAVRERINKEGDSLPGHRLKHLRGRLRVYQAKIERLEELREQYQLEIDLYLELLSQSR